MIVDADKETEIHRRLAGDPWTLAQRLTVVSIEQWNLFVGSERLIAAQRRASRSASYDWTGKR